MTTRAANYRFWANVPIGNIADCWEWQGCRSSAGYGLISIGDRNFTASRLMREIIDGKAVPNDLVVCHTCDNPPCVNPAHLFIGTRLDNARDMIAKGRRYTASKIICLRGHSYTPENTMWSGGARFCRACHRLRTRKYRALAKARAEQSA